MPTVLQYYAEILVGQHSTAPDTPLQAALQEGLQEVKKELGGNWEVASVSSSDSSSSISLGIGTSSVEVPGWREPGRLVGSQPLHVHIHAVGKEPSIKDVVEQLVEQQRQGQQKFAKLAGPRVSNCATSIVLLALQRQHFGTSTCDWASKPEAAGFLQQVQQATGVATTVLEQQLNSLVARRHSQHHPATPEALDQEVEDLAEILPDLKSSLRWECWVLRKGGFENVVVVTTTFSNLPFLRCVALMVCQVLVTCQLLIAMHFWLCCGSMK